MREPSRPSGFPGSPLCSGRNVVGRATSNRFPRNSAPPIPYLPDCKNCAPTASRQCPRARATQSSLRAAGVSLAQNCHSLRRVRTNSHTDIQNPHRDTSDEQGANNPARHAPAGPDPAHRPRLRGLLPHSIIANSPLVPVARMALERSPASWPRCRRRSGTPRVQNRAPFSSSILSSSSPSPFVLGSSRRQFPALLEGHLGLGLAMELVLNVIGQMASPQTGF